MFQELYYPQIYIFCELKDKPVNQETAGSRFGPTQGIEERMDQLHLNHGFPGRSCSSSSPRDY